MDYMAHRIFDVIMMLVLFAWIVYVAYIAKND